MPTRQCIITLKDWSVFPEATAEEALGSLDIVMSPDGYATRPKRVGANIIVIDGVTKIEPMGETINIVYLEDRNDPNSDTRLFVTTSRELISINTRNY